MVSWFKPAAWCVTQLAVVPLEYYGGARLWGLLPVAATASYGYMIYTIKASVKNKTPDEKKIILKEAMPLAPALMSTFLATAVAASGPFAMWYAPTKLVLAARLAAWVPHVAFSLGMWRLLDPKIEIFRIPEQQQPSPPSPPENKQE